jgi:hypothetical protein
MPLLPVGPCPSLPLPMLLAATAHAPCCGPQPCSCCGPPTAQLPMYVVRCPAAHPGPHGFWRVQWLKAAAPVAEEGRTGAVSNFTDINADATLLRGVAGRWRKFSGRGPWRGSRQHWTQHWSKSSYRAPGSGPCPARARSLRVATFPKMVSERACLTLSPLEEAGASRQLWREVG